jgi:hyperosmotically inducible periplasmic protein
MEIIMTKRLLLIFPTLAGALLLLAAPVRAEQGVGSMLAVGSPLENTQRNVRDKDGTTLTPDDQKGNKKDIKITTKIRKALVNDKSLSIDAQNIKIITSNRVVTLRGPVESANESATLEKIAKQTRSVLRVDNQLEIKTP